MENKRWMLVMIAAGLGLAMPAAAKESCEFLKSRQARMLGSTKAQDKANVPCGSLQNVLSMLERSNRTGGRRLETDKPFDPVAASPLTFEQVRGDVFPALGLGVQAGRLGGAAPAVFNAANERAVELFVDGKIGFVDIAQAIASSLEHLSARPGRTRDELIAADAAARAHVTGRFLC